jgi:hypothetical protein
MRDTPAQRKIGRVAVHLCRTVVASTCLAATALSGQSVGIGETNAPESAQEAMICCEVAKGGGMLLDDFMLERLDENTTSSTLKAE